MVLRISIVLLLAFVIFCASTSMNKIDKPKVQRQFTSTLDSNINVEGLQKKINIAKYYNLTELEMLLLKLEQEYIGIVKIEVIGEIAEDTKIISPMIQKKKIWAVNIKKPDSFRRPKPSFKFVANIHGDDAVGYALMVSLIQYLVYSYGHDPRITKMVNEINIWIVPTMNPDGFSRAEPGCDRNDLSRYRSKSPGKTNARNVDLDVDFMTKCLKKELFCEPETLAMIKFIQEHPFVLSGNLQSGALGASYPIPPLLTPKGDGVTFEHIARDYAATNPMMAHGNQCTKISKHGTMVGSAIQRKSGGMQEANYILSNCFELTLYVSCCQYPPASDLPLFWNNNLESMLKFIESTRRGIFGRVFYDIPYDESPRHAVITVEGKDKQIKATESGRYWRLLPPGTYNVTASAPGCVDKRVLVEVNSTVPYVNVDFVLKHRGVYGVVESYLASEIPNAVIRVKGEKVSIKVNNKGKYYWVTEKLGSFNLTASALMFYNRKKEVTLTEAKPYAMLNFFLTPI